MPSFAPGSAISLATLLASGHLLLATSPLFWAANWIIGRGFKDYPPFSMVFARWGFAVLFMLPFCWPHVRRDWPVLRRHWRWVLAVALLGGGFGNVLTYVGLKYTTAINGVFLNSFVPVIIVLLTWVFLGQRLSRLQSVGVLVSFVGVISIITRGSFDALLALRVNPGDLLLLSTLLIWSVYTIALRWRPAELHPMALLFVIAVQAVAVTVPAAAWEYANGQRLPSTLDTWAALAFVGLFSSFVAYVMYNRGVELCGAHLAGLYNHLMPVYGVLLAWAFLGERLAPFHLVGIALIMFGIWLASRGGPPPRADPDAPNESPG